LPRLVDNLLPVIGTLPARTEFICKALPSSEKITTSLSTGVTAAKSWSVGAGLKRPPSGVCCLAVIQ
jgi:hypothetical protein